MDLNQFIKLILCCILMAMCLINIFSNDIFIRYCTALMLTVFNILYVLYNFNIS